MEGTFHNPKYQTRISNVATNAVIIRRNDWKRMKKDSIHLTPEQIAENRRRQEEEKERTMSNITTKRSTMFVSQRSPQDTFRTHDILASTEEREYALKVADAKADEELDEIKTINSQMKAALARTERDGQLHERVDRAARELQEKRDWDAKMEENRQAQCRLYDERERSLKEQRRAGRAILMAQIEEHKINKILEAERKDREARALAEQNRRIAEEDRRIWLAKKKRQQDFMHDCLEANEAQRQRRIAEREREKEEAQMVIEFQAQKALREEALEQERRDRAALLEREVAAARKKQKRSQDYQAARDEAMAKKIQREKEERDREREERDQLKLIETVRQVKKDREEMIADKKLRLLEEAHREREMHRKVMEANEIAREKARKAWEAKVELDNQYRRELGEEVEREYERKRIDPMAKVREAEEMKRSNDAYLARIEALRQKKLNELRAKGVPEKYLVDIMADRFDIK